MWFFRNGNPALTTHTDMLALSHLDLPLPEARKRGLVHRDPISQAWTLTPQGVAAIPRTPELLAQVHGSRIRRLYIAPDGTELHAQPYHGAGLQWLRYLLGQADRPSTDRGLRDMQRGGYIDDHFAVTPAGLAALPDPPPGYTEVWELDGARYRDIQYVPLTRQYEPPCRNPDGLTDVDIEMYLDDLRETYLERGYLEAEDFSPSPSHRKFISKALQARGWRKRGTQYIAPLDYAVTPYGKEITALVMRLVPPGQRQEVLESFSDHREWVFTPAAARARIRRFLEKQQTADDPMVDEIRDWLKTEDAHEKLTEQGYLTARDILFGVWFLDRNPTAHEGRIIARAMRSWRRKQIDGRTAYAPQPKSPPTVLDLSRVPAVLENRLVVHERELLTQACGLPVREQRASHRKLLRLYMRHVPGWYRKYSKTHGGYCYVSSGV